jgi:soluble lytic murein transglycosylase-like protein
MLLQTFFALATISSFHLEKPKKVKHVRMIVEYAERHDQDPYELIALALTESNLNPRAVSWAGAVGLFQVMCKYWTKPLGYKTIKQCEKALFDPYTNMKAGVHVLTTYRKRYTHCQGDLAYRCYYAGQGWIKRTGRLRSKIERYENKVRVTREIIRVLYQDFIEGIRADVRAKI